MPNTVGKQATKIARNPPAEPPGNRQPTPVLSKSKSPQGLDHSLSRDQIPTPCEPSSNPPTSESLIPSPLKPVPPVRPRINTSQHPPPIPLQRPPGLEAANPRGYVSVDKQSNDHGNGLQAGPLNQPISQKPVPSTMRSPVSTTANASINRRTPSQVLSVDSSRHQVGQLDDTQPPARPQKAIPPVPRNSLPTTTQPPVTRPTVDNPVCPIVSDKAQPPQATTTLAPNKMPPPPRPLPAKSSDTTSGGLRMSTGKPRNKLMYSALLPGASRTLSRATSDPSSNSANDGIAAQPQVPESVCTSSMKNTIILTFM